MNNIKKFEEFSKIDEGWRELALGATLFLSTIFPTELVAKERMNFDGESKEYIVTDKVLTQEEAKNVINSIVQNGYTFDGVYDSIPVGDYIVVNLEGAEYSKSLKAIQRAIEDSANSFGMKVVKIYHFYKKTEGLYHQLYKIERVAIIKVEKPSTYDFNTF